jgi:hypothetical protein
MTDSRAQVAAITLGVLYLAAFGWAISNVSYDVWGVLVVVPPLGLIGALAIRRMFRGALAPLAPIMIAGLAAKLVGTAARYWVGFEAYGGGIDAARYHLVASVRAAEVWGGDRSWWSIIPSGTGTPFVEDITALVYALSGPSQMAGFVAFSLIGYLGVACFVKAACIAVPGLAQRRYAILCVLAPSLVYWPSSIGKEALIFGTLGVVTLCFAELLTGGRRLPAVVIGAAALAITASVRPHVAGVWLAGFFPALLALIATRGDGAPRTRDRVVLGAVLVVAAIGMIVVATATVRYLDPNDGEDTGGQGLDSLTSIVDETTRRTEQAGSNFAPPSLSNPANWPFAAARTLTRPLLIEARGAAQLLTAAELTVFLGLCVVSIRRVANLPRMVLRTPYVAFAMTALFLAGLAYSSFANLGILARQKSLVFPFLLLIVCLPPLPRRERPSPEEAAPELAASSAR